MAITSSTSKATAQASTFVGISSVYLKSGGFSSTSGAVTVNSGELVEVPCSQESGFTFDGGTPSINNFKIHGLTAAYTSTFTPGDGSLTIEIPTNNTTILDLVYGVSGSDLTVTLPDGDTLGGAGKRYLKGKAYPFTQKAIYLGIIAVDDAETQALFFKKIKATATPAFDGSEKPYAITLTATISAGSDSDAVAILTPSSTNA